MLFFVMAASIMAVCIITIHKIASHFGRTLPLSSLVLCGISAIIINFLVISVTPFLTKTYYYILGTMIVFAATGTTCYNKYLLYRKARLATATANIASDSVTLPTQIAPEISLEETNADVMVQEPAVLTDAVSSAPPVMEPTEAIVPEAVPELDSVLAEDMSESESDHLKLLETMETLDDILDFAFEQAPSQPQTAIEAYKYALERYHSDDYAPFIVIDMVNLYQSQEQYQEAMDCICQAMELPAIQDNPATRQNFQSYLSQIQALYNSKESR